MTGVQYPDDRCEKGFFANFRTDNTPLHFSILEIFIVKIFYFGKCINIQFCK